MTVSYSIYHTTRLCRTTHHNYHNASFLLCLFVFLVTDVFNASISTPVAYCVDTIRLKIPIEIFVIFSIFNVNVGARCGHLQLLSSHSNVHICRPHSSLRPASRHLAKHSSGPQDILNGDISPSSAPQLRAAESDNLCAKNVAPSAAVHQSAIRRPGYDVTCAGHLHLLLYDT